VTWTARRGFSLSEILLSLLILAVLSVLLVGVIPASVLGLRAAGQRVTAAQLARNEIEALRRGNLASLTDHALPEVTSNGTDYHGDVVIQPAQDADGNVMDARRARSILVTVRWRGRNGRPNAYECRSTVVRQL
jgi:uncharacterized protein (TIGR02598 family)